MGSDSIVTIIHSLEGQRSGLRLRGSKLQKKTKQKKHIERTFLISDYYKSTFDVSHYQQQSFLRLHSLGLSALVMSITAEIKPFKRQFSVVQYNVVFRF